MARRKQPPGPVVEFADLPADLHRESVTVERFVSWSEQPPSYWRDTDSPDYRDWRRIRAMRRWQHAVETWGAVRGLDRHALTTLGYWPGYPPRFESEFGTRVPNFEDSG